MTPLPFSVSTTTANEEARLPRTLTALSGWVDDIVIVDTGSADNTVEIAKDFGCRIFHRPWTGYGPQKHWAEQQCEKDWVFNLDADEVVTPELKYELIELFSAVEVESNAFNIRILNVYPGDDRPRPFAHDYNVVRLCHRAVASYQDHAVYDRVELRGIKP